MSEATADSPQPRLQASNAEVLGHPPRWIAPGASFVSAMMICPAAFAHGFGQRFDLPLPLSFWVLGAGLSIVISFIAVVIFVGRQASEPTAYPRFDLRQLGPGRWLSGKLLAGLLRTFALAMYVLVICTGLFGTQDPYRNLTPTIVWIIWWVGIAFASALFGDLWRVMNPLTTVFRGFERLAQRGLGRRLRALLHYPGWLGCWPAVFAFVLFAWAELVWESNDQPAYLAYAILGYSLYTWAGMLCFGREIWLSQAEVFSIVFRLISRFSPFETRCLDREAIAACPSAACIEKTDACSEGGNCWSDAESRSASTGPRQWNLRPPGLGLLLTRAPQASLAVLVLAMLATVSFDGVIETPLWNALASGGEGSLTGPALRWLESLGVGDSGLVTIGLVAIVTIFVVAYWGFALAAVWIDRREEPGFALSMGRVTEVAGLFVLTLIPIAIAYHLAHYLSLLLSAGQFAIPLLSDPFGWGWDLFSSANYEVRLDLIGAKTVWYVAVIAVVVGHVFSVYLAHVTALRVFAASEHFIGSQMPMLVLMVIYTMLSLWLLAQPIVG